MTALPLLLCNLVPVVLLVLASRAAGRLPDLPPVVQPAFAAAAVAGLLAAVAIAIAYAGDDGALVIGPMVVTVAVVGGFFLGGAAATVGAVARGRAEAWQLVPAVGILVLGLAGLVVLNLF